MTNIINPNDAIVEVNNALKDILSQHLKIYDHKVDIRFDLPEINSIPSVPTVSVFLYDIHEDLQLRAAEPRSYNPATSTLLPGWVNINYNYLITYWHPNKPTSDSTSPDSQPGNQAAKVMTYVLNALVNNRQLPKIPGAYTRVIPPQENLNSLGNFWQSLGNRPRLSLLYSVTAPIKLKGMKEDSITTVKQISASVDQKPNLNSLQINQALSDKLCADLGGTEDIRLSLAKVNLTTKPDMEKNGGNKNKYVILEASGTTSLIYLQKIKDIILAWKNSQDAVIEINGIGIILSKENHDVLIGI
ncbi:DUF4255 domain-containing protein [Photorhabdus sp. RM323S]|uniref:DUF4255 domain-containing protein n=1 Tax=Photorhabdus sp. RM323S TaxID=3342828 RepID=UPI0036DA5E2F